jgi:DNA-binding SARP family transcriptional activator/alkylated DNA nucleotide flippase Atl1
VQEDRGSVRFRLCSGLAVDGTNGTLAGRDLGSRKARTLIALLASERGHPVPLDRIALALWPEEPPADPGANVATLVSRTRRLLGADVLMGTGRSYGLSPGGPWSVDLDEAAAMSAEAAARLAAGEHVLAAAGARTALDLLGAQVALADEDDAEWVLAVRRDADTQRRRARHVLAEALTQLDPADATRVAGDAVAADPFDEQAVRDLMRAEVADGRSSAALAAYDALVVRLRDELGTAPDPPTAELHLAILRETRLPAEVATGAGPERIALVGREPELGQVEAAWSAAGSPDAATLLLVEGEAGIGKTRLLEAAADLAAHTGGRVLRGRCHPAERSLFLQPYVDALRPVLLDSPVPALTALVRDHVAAWVSLVPELAAVLPPGPGLPGDVDLQRRQAYDAVAAVLRRLALNRPVLLTVDDLQDGGAATVDLLGYLAGRLGGARVLLLAAVRAEDAATADRLTERATYVRLDALPPSAVEALAAAAGLASHGAQVMARTAGHPLSVVEYLRALASGDHGVPESLADAVLTRVGRLDEAERVVVEAAAVVRRRLDPRLLASIVDISEVATVRHCEHLVRLRLLVRSGDHYEFANDLLQECVYRALPPAAARAYHRRAADLTSDRPEVMAEHAYAAGDEPRAAHGWLLAGEAALRGAAVEDALNLLDRSLAVTMAPAGTRARALLARSAAHEALTSFRAALDDVDEALDLARGSGDRRLEMAALRARSADAAVALGLPERELVEPLETGLRLAADLGDRRAEADFSSRLSVLETSRLRLTTALARAEGAVARARAAESDDALVLSLDGLKTVWSNLADPDRLQEVVADLEPRVRARGDTWLLQWVVFEAALVPAARGRFDEARGLVAEALELNRLSGYPAYAGFLLAYDGWFARLAGDLDTARHVGRAAVEATSPVRHPWWYVIANGFLAATLVETGERAEAEVLARRGLAAGDAAAVGGRLRCQAALAAVTGEEQTATEATRLLDAVTCPPGHAWVVGADCYLLLAAAARDRGDAVEAARLVEPLLAATGNAWAEVRARAEAFAPQTRSRTSSAARTAPSVGTGR